MNQPKNPTHPTTMLEWALAYHRAGWSIIPITGVHYARAKENLTEGSPDTPNVRKWAKKPLLYKWKSYIHTPATEAQIRGWWAKWPLANIGGICGPVSGRVVIDVDPRNGGVHAGHKHTPVEAVTGGAGWHFVYKWPTQGPAKKLPKLPGVDIIGEGKYVILAPSTHPSGGTYAWEPHPDCRFSGGVPAQGAEADPPEFLLPREEEDDFAGLTAAAPEGERWIAAALRSPIKEGGGPHGGRANTAVKLAGALVGTYELPNDVAHTVLMSWRDRCCLGEGAPTDEELGEMVQRLRGSEDEQHWDELRWRVHGPDVDLSPLGPQLRSWVEYIAALNRAPIEGAIGVCFGVLSAAACRGHVIDCHEWDECCGTFIIVGMGASTQKTPLLKTAMRPLTELEIQCSVPSEEHYAATAEVAVAKAALARELRKTKTPPDPGIVAELQMRVDQPVPPSKRYLATDVTPEELECKLVEQGTICVHTDELAKVLSNMSGYKKNGIPDFNAFLAMWSGGHLSRDRRSTGHQSADRVTGALVGMVQPDALPGLLPARARASGLLARILWIFPRRIKFDPTPVPKRPGLATWWERKIQTLARHEPVRYVEPTTGDADPFEGLSAKIAAPELTRIKLTDASHHAVLAFRAALDTEAIASPGDAEWLSKMHGQLVRVAACLWLIENGPGENELPIEYIDRARCLIEQFFMPNARLASRLVESDSSERAARLIWHHVQERRTFGLNALKELPLSSEARYHGLQFLRRNGWIRSRSGKKITYAVNPFGQHL